MKSNLCKRICCLLAIFSYALGSVLAPSAENDNSVLNNLLEINSMSENTPAESDENKSFSDVQDSEWYYPYVMMLSSKGIINGTTDTTFSPQNTFSVAECCAVISRYLGLDELAENRRQKLIECKNIGADKWYSGYVQIIYEAGIINVSEFADIDPTTCTLNLKGDSCERPIKRFEFANLITRSFDITTRLCAQNTHPEIGGRGHEFIAGGAYDMDAVNLYSTVISDFDDIPNSSQKNVLKAYYNGIFTGDNFGKFNPMNNLTRAEMAKVIAVVGDYSMRTRLPNILIKASDIDSSMLFTDSLGNTSLKKNVADSILRAEANNITMSNGDFTYERSYAVPIGYAVDIYVYSTGIDSKNRLTGSSTLANSNSELQKAIFCWVGNAGKARLVLRNLSENSRPEGVLDISLSNNSPDSFDYSDRFPW